MGLISLRGLLCGFWCLALATGAWAAGTVYVSLDGSHSSPYDTWEKAATNIQTAVDYACANIGSYDTVLVSNGIYYASNSITSTVGINITEGLTVKSLNGREATIVNGTNLPARIFIVSNANAVVEGFTITGGKNNGMILYNGMVSNCLIAANQVGIWMLDGVVTDCVISNNTGGSYGAGIYGAVGGGLINRSVIVNNSGSSGGAGVMRHDGSSLRLENCLVACNISQNDGAAVRGGKGALVNCTIVSNRVTQGSVGGIMAFLVL